MSPIFVGTCESCQIHLNIRYRDELHQTYPLTIHFKWLVDLVSLRMGVGKMRYLVFAREHLTKHVEFTQYVILGFEVSHSSFRLEGIMFGGALPNYLVERNSQSFGTQIH